MFNNVNIPLVFQNPRIYEDRDIRTSPSRQAGSTTERNSERLHQRFKRTLISATQRSASPLHNASDEETSGSADVRVNKKAKLRKSKDVFKPPTPQSSSPE